MIFGIIILAIILLIYSPWFTLSGTLSSGDWTYLFKENIAEFSFSSRNWILWLAPYYQITAKIFVEKIGLSWEITERLFWFWPFLITSIFSSYYLTRSLIGVLIHTTNTYILMLVSGGQMGVAMGYAISPFLLGRFTNGKTFSLKSSFVTGVVLAVQIMFDPRIAYVCLIAAFLYVILFKIKKIFYFMAVSVIGLLFNYWWILRFLQGTFPKGVEDFRNVEGFNFLSFADFSHALSFLHPNWPENIFGKIYFLKAEFLILPIVAYISLIFLGKIKNQRNILFFSLLGLLGAFFAKGSNPPFGFNNEWLFQYFPGISLFRDSTKFYLLVALSYSFLIPFALTQISKKFLYFKTSLIIIFLIFWCLLIRNAFFGGLNGTFKTYTIPAEYLALKDFIKNQNEDFSILWIPERHRYGFYSNSKTFVPARELLNIYSPIEQAMVLNDKKNQWNNYLKNKNIKYIILPYDSQQELFIEDRKYSEKMRNAVESEFDQIEWLKSKKTFGGITLYEVKR